MSFIRIVTGGLFDVHVFACLTGPDGSRSVPVLGKRHGDGMHFLIGENVFHVFEALRGLTGQLVGKGNAAFQVGLIDIAEAVGCGHPVV